MMGKIKSGPMKLHVDSNITELDRQVTQIANTLLLKEGKRFETCAVLEKESMRMISSFFWNVWVGNISEHITNGEIVSEKSVAKLLSNFNPGDNSSFESRKDAEGFFRVHGYKLAYTIAHDELGQFWVQKEGKGDMTVFDLKNLKHQ